MSYSYKVLDRFYDSAYWNWTEHLCGLQDLFMPEKFIPATEWKDAEIIKHFGTTRPHSCEILLHCLMPATTKQAPPVLMIHGASHHANLSWGRSINEERGLLRRLRTEGRTVFAVTFAHPHGDNLFQAVQLFNCIQRILELTNHEKVDLVAHSKGGVAAWTFLAGWGQPWRALPNGVIDKYFMLGTPNRGIDYPFRHLTPNWWVKHNESNAPLSCDSMLWYGQYIDTTEHSIYKDGGAFPGLSQLLCRFDEEYPIHPAAQTLYRGGQNWLIHSRGIDEAIQEGGNYMERLLQTPVETDLELYALAGNYPLFHGFLTEWDGPSDGLVFVDSVLYTEGISANPDQVKRKTVLPLNHLDLLYHPSAQEWLLEGLIQ